MLECILCGKIIVQNDNPKHYSVCSSCNVNDLTNKQKKFIEMGINYLKLEKSLKQKAIHDLCYELDQLYFYAKELIPKNVEHNLGFRKEKLKGDIEIKILGI